MHTVIEVVSVPGLQLLESLLHGGGRRDGGGGRQRGGGGGRGLHRGRYATLGHERLTSHVHLHILLLIY